jgi:exodeoxyribonuclease V gamma subunit
MLGSVLSVPLADPLQAEVIVVPTRGIERWLTQQLSKVLGTSAGRADGACANVELPFPGKLLGDVVARASGIDPETDPWGPNRAVWYLLDLLDQHLDEPWLAALRAHLASTAPSSEVRRFAAVRRVADLFDRYGVHRPDVLLEWAEGRDSLPPEDRWQAGLWRLLRQRVGVPSPPERTAAACMLLRDRPAAVDLPRRVSVFGVTRLPASYLDVLGALAYERDVHLFLLHPSPAVWDRVAARRAARPPGKLSLRRREDDAAQQATSSLLRSWGQEALEMQTVLDAAVSHRVDHHLPIESGDGGPLTLLARVQADVRADRAPPGAPRPGSPELRATLDLGDDSIRIHGCHGRARQVEVLRDALLHLFDEHPDLETRDVVVMCPDIETYAPLVQAAFGAAGGAVEEEVEGVAAPAGGQAAGGDASMRGLPAAGMRVRLADRSLRQTNPLLGVLAQLLELAASRVSASQVLDFAGRDPVSRRFGLEVDDLTRLEEWVAAAGIRWGLDAHHRAPFRLGSLEANTWRAGFDRILLGVTMADERQRRFGAAVPLDDVDSGDIDLAGRLAPTPSTAGATRSAPPSPTSPTCPSRTTGSAFNSTA